MQVGGGTLDLFLKNECSNSHVDCNRTHRHKPVQKARDAITHTLELILQCHDLNPWEDVMFQKPSDTVDQPGNGPGGRRLNVPDPIATRVSGRTLHLIQESRNIFLVNAWVDEEVWIGTMITVLKEVWK